MPCGRSISLALIVATGYSVTTALPTNAGGEKVVENTGHGLWDDEPRRNFHLLENLYLGSEDGDDAFGRVADVAVDSRGRWLILDGAHELLRVYDPEAMTLDSIGRKGQELGELWHPTAVGVDARDNMYVASQDGRVAVFSRQGDLIGEFRHDLPGAAPIRSIRTGAGGIYLSSLDPVEHTIVHRYDADRDRVGSFSRSHAAVKAMDRKDEIALCAGAIDLDANGFVYFTQATPYEIRKFSPEGTLLLTIRRENDFMQPPRVEQNGEMTRYHEYAASVGVFALADGVIANVAKIPGEEGLPPKTVVDLFDAEGRLLKSRSFPRKMAIRCRDRTGQLYAVEERSYPVVVRYRLEVH